MRLEMRCAISALHKANWLPCPTINGRGPNCLLNFTMNSYDFISLYDTRKSKVVPGAHLIGVKFT